jgi:periplasmic divalent cation tolerance protein
MRGRSVWSSRVIPQPPTGCIVVFVTAPDMDVARKVARAALDRKLAACANILSQVESHYWWEGKLEQNAEVLIIFKTTQQARAALQECVLANHPYQTAEFIALPIEAGSPAYLRWIAESVSVS